MLDVHVRVELLPPLQRCQPREVRQPKQPVDVVDIVVRLYAERRRVRGRNGAMWADTSVGDWLIPEGFPVADVLEPRVEVAELAVGELEARRAEPALADLNIRPRRDRLDGAVDLLSRRRGILVWQGIQLMMTMFR